MQKKIFTNIVTVEYLKKEIKGAATAEETLKLIGALGGGSVGVKSLKEMKKTVQKLLAKKLTILPGVLLAAQAYVEGMNAGVLAKDLQKMVDTYTGIHSTVNNASAPAASGIYAVITNISTQNGGFGLSFVTPTTTYYDIMTKQYLGETTIR